jgi:WD40 repeat protein
MTFLTQRRWWICWCTAAALLLPSLGQAQSENHLRWLNGGHAGSVGAVAWSPNGTLIASASDDTTIKLWSTNGALLQTLTTHPYQATALAFAPDGTQLAVGTYAGGYYYASNGLGRVLLWQSTNDWTNSSVTLLRTMTNRCGKITAVTFSANGAYLASGNAAGSNIVRRISDGAVIAQMAAYSVATNLGALHSLAFSSSGLLASACEDGSIRIWNSSWSPVWQTNRAHVSNVTAVAFSPDGTLLASGSLDQTIKLWTTNGWTSIQTLTGHTGGVTSLAFSPKGTVMASGSADQTIRLWDIASGTCLATIAAHADSVTSVAFSPDGTRLVSGGQDNYVNIWSPIDGALIQTLGGHADYIKAIAISPDGTLCATASNDPSIQVRRLSDGRLLCILPGHAGCVSAIAWAPDSAVLASGGGPLDPTIKLWSLSDGAVLQTIAANTNGVMALAFSPDGTMLASGGDFDERTIQLWNVRDGSLLQTLAGHSNGVTSLAFSPRGNLLISGGRRFDNTVKIWAFTDGSLVRTWIGHSHNIEAVACSPDGNIVASGSSGTNGLQVWQVTDGSSRSFGTDTNPVLCVAFSPDGSTLASAHRNAIKLWNIGAGSLSQTITQETLRVSCLAYSPNGNLLVYGREDATLALAANSLGALGQPQMVFNAITAGAGATTSLEATAQPLTHYVIQSSTNLVDWAFLTLTVSDTNSVQIIQAPTTGAAVQFYRAITPP